MFKALGRVIASAILLVLTGLMASFARYAPDWFFSFYTDLSRRVAAFLGKIVGPLPFSVCEVLIVLLLLWGIYTLVRVICRRKGLLAWLVGVLLAGCIGLFLFTALWGLNHFGPSVTEKLGMETELGTREELVAATNYFLDQANALSAQTDRAADGTVSVPSFRTLAQQAVEDFSKLSETYDYFTEPVSPPKRIFCWYPMSKAGFTGIYLCFTGESCVNPDTYPATLPFTMCHELAHSQAVAAEEDANFVAFLACMGSDDPLSRYSACFNAFIYCYNALWEKDQSAALEIAARMNDAVRADNDANNARYAEYDGVARETVQQLNDTYLKAFSEELGVESYGAVADNLVAWYRLQQTETSQAD
jgi:hypothetical protein